ncbi:MAG TPA: SpoIIE family protein phosphatase, partial [Methylomirabilota bacterium]|nr:SpoIIE family protein phosphatase [Methylomirabilota bacterium]
MHFLTRDPTLAQDGSGLPPMKEGPDALSHLRHELRTPLNHIIGYTEMLLEEETLDDGLEEGLRQLRGEAGEVLTLVNEVLSAGRVDGEPLADLSARAGRPLERLVGAARGLLAGFPSAGLPDTAADLARIAAAAERLADLVRNGTPSVMPSPPAAAPTAQPEPDPARPALLPATILIVDDNAENRDMLARRLQREGHQVRVAEGGHAALAALAEAPTDLVLLDVMMPDLDGYAVLGRLKADPRLRHVPVIMISALDNLASVIRCIQLGAEDYLPKPFDATLLRARIGASLEKKRLRDEIVGHLDRMEKELESAREIQLSMVPSAFPDPTPAHPVAIHATLRPARQVGGDLYDIFRPDPHTVCVVVADVSDKGAPAAIFMARAKTLVRMVAMLLQTPGGGVPRPEVIIDRVNQELCRDNPHGMFVTLFLGLLDVRTGDLRFTNAGHPPPYRLARDTEPGPLTGGRGKPLGIRETFVYPAATVRLGSGEGLFLFTDGITEAMDTAGDFFGEPRLEAVLGPLSGASPRVVV